MRGKMRVSQMPPRGWWAGILLVCVVVACFDAKLGPAQQSADPASLYEKQFPLFDLLTQADLGQGPPITEIAQWVAKRQLIKDKWLTDLLGAFPAKVPLDIRERGTIEYAAYTQKQIDYATEVGDRVNAYLLLPKPLGKDLPAVMALNPTSIHGAASVVGLAEKEEWWYARELVRRGFVVLAPDILTEGERIYPGREAHDSRPFYESHGNWSMMGKMLWDHMRGVDVLQSLAFVDPKRIGALGWSLGAHNTAFLAAFDDRVAAAVTDGGMYMIAGDSNPFRWCRQQDTSDTGVAQFFGMPKMRSYLESGNVPFDLHEIQALLAPRPYLDMNSVMAEDNWRGGVAAARKVGRVYQLYGKPDHFANRVFDGPHGFRPDMRKVAYEWLDRWLKNSP